MSLTASLREELVRQMVTSADEMAAEVAAVVRFAGGLHMVSGRIVIEAELDSALAAARLRTFLMKLYRASSTVVVVSSASLKKGERYVVRVVERAAEVARYTGLTDQAGRPVRGLPPQIVSAGHREAVAAWRGAFIARGTLMEPGRSSSMEVTAPGPEAALGLVGLARRLGALAKSREVRGAHRVVIRDADGILSILKELNTEETYEAWMARHKRREARGSANRLANFDDANLRRSVRAAVAASARVERAFEILGEDMPEHLREAGELRLSNRQASLEELGRMASPQLTKDAVAGRIRRLLALADKAAHERDIPDTESALTYDMLEE